MSNVNGNDIDDLFKRAADGYPLRTNSSDWDRLAADLEKDPSLILPPLYTETDRSKRRRFFWLFLLLPLGGLGYLAWQSGWGQARPAVVKPGQETVAKAGDEAAKTKSPDAVNGGVKGTIDNGKTDTKREVDRVKPTEAEDVEKAGADRVKGNEDRMKPGTADRVKGTEVDRVKTGTVERGKGTETGRLMKKSEVESVKTDKTDRSKAANRGKGSETDRLVKTDEHEVATADKMKDELRKKGRTNDAGKGLETTEKKRDGLTIHEKTKNEMNREKTGNTLTTGKGRPVNDVTMLEKRGNGQVANDVVRNDVKMNDAKVSPLTAQRAGIGGSYTVDIPVKPGSGQAAIPAKENHKKIKIQQARPSFYVGLMAAPDLSTIKFQSIKGTGTTYGVLLGYSWNSRWAVETGLYLDRKKYYTDGEYFDKKGYPWLNYVDKLKVNGICNMLELPVNVRYNLGLGEKTKWFATAGLSTYFMSKQYYDYTGWYNGAAHDWSVTNKEPLEYWFSIINLSIGYEQKLGKIGNLRIEPTVRVPLAGVGTGKLSIMSTGLNIGITRKIW